MPRKFLARAALAAVLGCGVCVDLARAQGWGYYPRTPAAATELPPGAPPVDSSPVRRPFREWVRNGRPLGCWSSFNGYSCSSLHSELSFAFGSCRTFFGQPCLKGAPPSALPPWSGPESGYWPGGPERPTPGGLATQAKCACGID